MHNSSIIFTTCVNVVARCAILESCTLEAFKYGEIAQPRSTEIYLSRSHSSTHRRQAECAQSQQPTALRSCGNHSPNRESLSLGSKIGTRCRLNMPATPVIALLYSLHRFTR